MWCSKEYHYETDFLREELAGSGGHPSCNEHASLFMNTVIDVLLTILSGRGGGAGGRLRPMSPAYRSVFSDWFLKG